jgi:uncharacterized membrane-anchored protein
MTSRRRSLLYAVVVLAQLLALGAIVLKREHLLRTGEVVRLRCRPLDPRSVLSGDYVELTYLISSLSQVELKKLNRWNESFERRDTVYLAMTRAAGEETHHPAAISHRPERVRPLGVVLRGTVTWPYPGVDVRYGVETYFVPQNEGPRIEAHQGDAVVEVAVSRSTGESAIRRLFVKGQELVFY